MSLPGFIVKVCGITRREDALAAADAGASAIGFIFYSKSPRCIAPGTAADLGRDLLPWKVGIFVNESPAVVEAAMRVAHLDVAQIYGGKAPVGVRAWKAFRVADSLGIVRADDAEAVLLDGVSNGNSFDWSIARDFTSQNSATKIIVAGGLDASNVAEAIRTARPWGVDASSRLEISPGVKDREKIRLFVQAALRAAKNQNLGQEAVKELS